MSWQATQYARDVLEHNTELKLGARLVLMLCAERANRDRAETYTGGWLVSATAMHPSSVRRSLYELEGTGLIALQARPGKSTVVRFPLAGVMLSTPRADERAVASADPALLRATPRADARDAPRSAARRTGLQPRSYPDDIPLCSTPSCPCDGTGWLFVDGEDRGRGYVTPCAGRSAGYAGQAPKAAG